MDMFKFDPPAGQDSTVLQSGNRINGATSKLWVERYRTPGEFEIVAPLGTGLRTFLPLGTMVSHEKTLETMVVENHHISEERGVEPTITISGRSFSSFMEQRVVGKNQSVSNPVIQPITLAATYSWNQVRDLIISTTLAGATDVNDRLTGVIATAAECYTIGGEEQIARTIKRQSLFDAVHELMQIDDIGLKSVRPNALNPGSALTWSLHRGDDRSSSVIFRWASGDIQEGEYLWSNKVKKNSILVNGKWISTQVAGPQVRDQRRWTQIDASDIDGHLDTAPVNPQRATIISQMQVRGRQILKGMNDVNVIRIQPTTSVRIRFGIDYNIGDFVTVHGNFGTVEKMRVTEYVVSEDSDGEVAYPTLSVPGTTL